MVPRPQHVGEALMFAVMQVAHRVGAATAEALLKRGQKVRVLVTEEAAGERWLGRHAEVRVVDAANETSLAAALEGMSGAFLMLPSEKGAEDPLAAQGVALSALVHAVKQAKLKRLVFLSAVGAQHPSGTGPLVGLHRAEKALSAAAPSVTFLRAALFLERWADQLLDALDTGELRHAGHVHLKYAQVGAHDVGEAAAQALEEGTSGTRVVEVAGKENWSAEDVAAALSSLLGQPIKAVERSAASPELPPLEAELYQGLARGLLQFAHAHEVRRGGTSLFDALRPLV